jgi:hypothetical protein
VMPRATWVSSDELRIVVHDFQGRYLPGDTLKGHVERTNSSSEPCTVKLLFTGRVKAKFVCQYNGTRWLD